MKSLNSAIFILLFAAVVSGVYLYTTGDLKLFDRETSSEGDPGMEVLKTEEDFKNKLAALRMDREKLSQRKKLMEERKQETVKFLKDKGVTATSDLSDKDVKYAISNLKQYITDLKDVDKNVSRYTNAINAVEAMLTKIKQQSIADEVNISDEKKIELSAMIKGLEDKLIGDEPDFIEEEKLRKLLGDELDE